MKREVIVIISLVLALVFFASCKSSQQNQSRNERGSERGQQKRPTVEQLFEKMDTDKDGKLSEKEVKGPLVNDFDKIDADEDGFLSKEEIEKAPKPSVGRNGMGQNRPEF